MDEEKGIVLAAGFMDHSGKIVIALLFEGALDFSGDRAAVRDEKKWGYIDRSGKIVITCQFDEAGQFQDGIALVQLGAQRGYIDLSGKFIWGPVNWKVVPPPAPPAAQKPPRKASRGTSIFD